MVPLVAPVAQLINSSLGICRDALKGRNTTIDFLYGPGNESLSVLRDWVDFV
ncbi:hypothetical Protein YC6258_02795 [Gynuella sunshinyii YC6258]|uniref:Uncharacterized protein n=1 Tax=Gynuella sunshinyii YC6258 TaxID=1445510 RepID=A0A0C5VN97_9GAMM|nr:hypothetical Protein YC6258_02795 [Gynuella sunshinyii YC6258]